MADRRVVQQMLTPVAQDGQDTAVAAVLDLLIGLDQQLQVPGHR